MKAVSQDELGEPEVLKFVTLPIPQSGASEILIRVHTARVHRSTAHSGRPRVVGTQSDSGCTRVAHCVAFA
jgi:NADPH:quinone reductase-like Zn-dependent oxidoreductase